MTSTVLLVAAVVTAIRCQAGGTSETEHARSVLLDRGIDTIRVGGRTSHHPNLVLPVLCAITNAQPDSGVYDCIPSTRIDLCKGETHIHRVEAVSFLFWFDGRQYRDPACTLPRIAGILQAGLENRAAAEQDGYTRDDKVQIAWTIHNYSQSDVLLPSAIRGKMHWAREDPMKKGRWEDQDDWTSEFAAGSGEVVSLPPDKTHTYRFAIPSAQLPVGRIRFWVTDISQTPKAGTVGIPQPNEVTVMLREEKTRRIEPTADSRGPR